MLRKKEGFAGQRSCVLPTELMRQIAAYPLCENLYITDIGYYPHAALHARERREGSPKHILIYCVKGEGWYYLNDQKHTFRETSGSFRVVPHRRWE